MFWLWCHKGLCPLFTSLSPFILWRKGFKTLTKNQKLELKLFTHSLPLISIWNCISSCPWSREGKTSWSSRRSTSQGIFLLFFAIVQHINKKLRKTRSCSELDPIQRHWCFWCLQRISRQINKLQMQSSLKTLPWIHGQYVPEKCFDRNVSIFTKRHFLLAFLIEKFPTSFN